MMKSSHAKFFNPSKFNLELKNPHHFWLELANNKSSWNDNNSSHASHLHPFTIILAIISSGNHPIELLPWMVSLQDGAPQL